MKSIETLEDFYKNKISWVPDNLKNEIGHFNVFKVSDYVGPKASPIPYSRRDFYKIGLMIGKNRYHYADKSIDVNTSALLFANPMIPYLWEHLQDEQSGFFCVFTEAFINRFSTAKLQSFSVFQPSGQPIYTLTKVQVKEVSALFKKMFVEIGSDYAHKYDLIRNYVFELIHFAMKLQPATTLYNTVNASTRIASLFTELLERQFPIESPGSRLSLRSAADYASQLSVHVNHLNRALKEVTGKTTSDIIAERMVKEAQAMLKHTDWNVAEIGYCLGFEEPAHFNNFFKKQTQRTPRAYRSV